MSGVNFTAISPIEPGRPEGSNKRIELQLMDLAKHLPARLPFPFSGKIAFQVGEGDIIEASHFPQQNAPAEGYPLNVLSVGKLFTAVAVMQLEEKGILSLDTPLDKLLDSKEMDLKLDEPYSGEKPNPTNLDLFRANAHRITVGDLLTHRSGLMAGDGPEEFHLEVPKHPYSNYGYQLLAAIIGKHSLDGDKSDYIVGFKKHVEERIFKPANMQGAIDQIHHPFKGTEPKFNVDKEGLRVEDETIEPYAHGNGCWRMQPKDLLLFGQSIRNNSLFTKDNTVKRMLESDHPIGFVVNRDHDNNIVGYGHPGGGPGQSSFLHTWLTDPPITATVLSNYSNNAHVKPFLDPIIPSIVN